MSRFEQPRIGIAREVRVGVTAFAALLLFGTTGLKFAGGVYSSWFDSFYMTVLTVSLFCWARRRFRRGSAWRASG